SSSLGYATNAKRARDDKAVSDKENAAVEPSLDNNTLTEVHHSNNDIFENVFDFEILNHEQLEVETLLRRQCLYGKKGLGFENQNDIENPFVLNKAKELTPSLYNIDEMGKDLLSDHKIISEEELTCEAGKRLEVKQIKSPLLYHGFVYGETQFQEPPKVPLKRRQVNFKKHLEQAQLNHEGDVLRKVQERLSEEFEPLARNINLLLNSFEKILVKEMKDDLKYVLSLEDEFDEKCLILDIQT
ncbi:hypothetical protein Tco_1390853, partial [Tanacetum coccineum]